MKMISTRWLYSELPISLRELSSLMLANQYSEKSGRGFLLSSSNSESLTGKYIEKTIENIYIEDPLGNKIQSQSTVYYICKFEWNSKSKLLSITDPPRSLRKFINEIRSMVGLGVVVADINFDIEKWISEIESRNCILTIDNISCYGVRTKFDCLAKINVKGTTDVRRDLEALLDGKTYKLDSLKFRIEFENGVSANGELTKTGSCKFSTSSTTFFTKQLRDSLEPCIP